MNNKRLIEVIPVWLPDEQEMPDLKDMEDGKVYISNRHQTSAHKCACGCGELTIMPFGNKGKWWTLTNNNGKITFTPSVGNMQFPCRSHYFITNNKVNFV